MSEPILYPARRLVCTHCGTGEVHNVLFWPRDAYGSPLTQRAACPRCGRSVAIRAAANAWVPLALYVDETT